MDGELLIATKLALELKGFSISKCIVRNGWKMKTELADFKWGFWKIELVFGTVNIF